MSTANKFAKELRNGSVNVNTYFANGVMTPFGGMKGSGFGRELSDEGLHNFLECKTVIYDFN